MHLAAVLLVSTLAVADSDYLQAARSVANQLTALARDEGARGLSWPASNITTARLGGMDIGSAGVGTFFLELYRATHESQYLVTAERASTFSFADARRSGAPNGPDFMSGAAGIGGFALELYAETKRSVHLENAQWAANWLVQTALRDAPGVYWRFTGVPRVYTGRYHGAAGIGLFLLDAYEATGDESYLTTARDAGRWLQQHLVRFNEESIGWKRLTDDVDAYHGWCGGSTGIMDFLARLSRLDGGEAYLALYAQTANGLVSHAVPVGADAVGWPYYSTPQGGFPVIFCHGAASTAVALYQAWRELGDSQLLQTARRAATWTESTGIDGSNGRYWPHIQNWDQYETGYQTGVASVGHAFLLMNTFDPHDDYVAQARAAAAYLLNIAEHPAPDRLRWINYTNPERPDWKHEYGNGWYSGAAGIGIFFIELDAAVRAAR